ARSLVGGAVRDRRVPGGQRPGTPTRVRRGRRIHGRASGPPPVAGDRVPRGREAGTARIGGVVPREAVMFLFAHGETGSPGGPFPPWEAHPATVHFPIAFLVGAVALDLYAWWRARPDLARIATGLMAAGVIAGVVAAATGAVAFFTVPAHTAVAHTLMYWHLGLMAGAVTVFAGVTLARRRAVPPAGWMRVAGLFGVAVLLV